LGEHGAFSAASDAGPGILELEMTVAAPERLISCDWHVLYTDEQVLPRLPGNGMQTFGFD
jgi:hypothetical protein